MEFEIKKIAISADMDQEPQNSTAGDSNTQLKCPLVSDW